MKAAAVIVAGGKGIRMGMSMPKQLLPIGGKPIILRTLEPFDRCPEIVEIVMVISPSIITDFATLIDESDFDTPIKTVRGGSERQQSVMNGLEATSEGIDVVAIHDAVRPFITTTLISECLHTAYETGAVTVMRRCKETVKAVEDGCIVDTIDRSRLWIAQTPQAFKKDLIIESHRKAAGDGFIATDDCMVAEYCGHTIRVIEGNDSNIKITTPTDLLIAEEILRQWKP